MRPSTASSILILSLAGLALGMRANAPQEKSPATNPERLVQMRHHFSQVFVIHEALIRGDLAAVRQPAKDLALLPAPTGLPDGAAPFVANLRSEAQRAGDATTLQEAATATSRMLTQCGDCHRAVGAVGRRDDAGRPRCRRDRRPHAGAPAGRRRHARGPVRTVGIAMAPRADGLRVAALQPAQLPSDPKLTASLRAAETRLHALAKEADGDTDARRT